MNIKNYLFSFLVLTTIYSSISAAWKNTGTMNLADSQMSLPAFENNGQMILSGQSNLTFNELSGSGIIIIENGTTTLKAKQFLFQGTIECNGTLTILTTTPESEITIARKGNGTITFRPLQ